jgi:chromosome segregation ATPase
VPSSGETTRPSRERGPWQSQAEEKAKEAEGLRTSLADKAAALATAEEQLRQELVARQQAEGQLQQERAALVEARAALERERLAREEVLGRLQQERTALEGAQVTLKQREDEASKLNGKLVQLSVSLADARQSVEEQEATVLSLQQAAEDARQALEAEKKQVEGALSFVRFLIVDLSFRDPLPTFLFLFVAFRPAGRLGEFDNPGPSRADGPQLLTTGVGGVAGHRTRGLPGG